MFRSPSRNACRPRGSKNSWNCNARKNLSYLSVPEKLRNGAADWHNLILTWESLSQEGFLPLQRIASLKISLWSKGEIGLESSRQASNRKEENRSSMIRCFWRICRPTFNLTKTQIKKKNTQKKCHNRSREFMNQNNHHGKEEDKLYLLSWKV